MAEVETEIRGDPDTLGDTDDDKHRVELADTQLDTLDDPLEVGETDTDAVVVEE